MIFSGENTNTSKEILGGVFLLTVAFQSLSPRGTAIAVEGACVTLEF